MFFPLQRRKRPSLLECFLHAPSEIWMEIGSCLEPRDILRLSLTCTEFKTLLEPELYASMVLASNNACLNGLQLLQNKPQVRKYVRYLSLGPNSSHSAWPRKISFVDEAALVRIVCELADSGTLENLEEFEWAGMQTPSDRLWGVLRAGCPRLRDVANKSGLWPEQTHEFFQFSDLTSFEFRTPPVVSESHPTMAYELAAMLTNRCPNLEHLSIRLFYSALALPIQEMDGLYSHTFPKLRSLNIDFWLYLPPSTTPPSIWIPDPFMARLSSFLARHPLLEELSLLPYPLLSLPSKDILRLSLPPAALPRLRRFTGVPQHLAQLPQAHTLEELDLIGEPIRVEADLEALARCTALRSLDIRLDAAALFGDLVAALPTTQLRAMHVMLKVDCEMNTMKPLATHLTALPCLRSFHLNIGRPTGRGKRALSMFASAHRIFAANPAIREVGIGFFDWNTLWVKRSHGLYRRVGVATPVSGQGRDKGKGEALACRERGTREWRWSFRRGGGGADAASVFVQVGLGVFERRFRKRINVEIPKGEVVY
ncbi:F-box domain-containing protein [Mycena kentingensis (nom. inval.)]|nr:F-box domain-containing protein [Mycena kentingensis (nom. inval.)]